MLIPIAQPFLGDEECDAVLAVLRSGQLVQGARVMEFEERCAEYLGARHAVAVNSGTAALTAVLFAHGVGPGDEVIVPAFSFFATAAAVCAVGARPVFADIEADTFHLSLSATEAAITPRTRALLPVHLYGQAAPLGAFTALAERHGLVVIEDAAQAFGAAIGDERVGQFGTAAFSFHASKNLTTGEGGLVTTSSAAVAHRLRLYRNQGSETRYRHELLGQNLRMTEIAAAIGIAQLRRLPAWNEARRENARFYDGALHGMVTPTVLPGHHHVYQQYTLRAPHHAARERILAHLHAQGIDARVYYPTPLHEQPAFVERGLGAGAAFPVAEAACREVLSIPVHPHLTREQLETVAREVNASYLNAAPGYGP